MTHKEKALELVDKFYNTENCHKKHIPNNHYCDCSEINMFQSIKCAIITVDEIIEQWDYIHTYLGDGNGELNPNLKYWQEVKQELEKML